MEQLYVAPRTELEESVAKIWSDMLGLREVGIEDNFFALGGDSLIALRLLTRVREMFGVQMPIASLVGPTPTISSMVVAIVEALAAEQGEQVEGDPASVVESGPAVI
jgi:acyl carrier protein